MRAWRLMTSSVSKMKRSTNTIMPYVSAWKASSTVRQIYNNT